MSCHQPCNPLHLVCRCPNGYRVPLRQQRQHMDGGVHRSDDPQRCQLPCHRPPHPHHSVCRHPEWRRLPFHGQRQHLDCSELRSCQSGLHVSCHRPSHPYHSVCQHLLLLLPFFTQGQLLYCGDL